MNRDSLRTSIVCSVYAHKEIEAVCVKNIIKYSRNYELFIVDANKPNEQNLSALWNRYAALASSEVIIFINSDACPTSSYEDEEINELCLSWNERLAHTLLHFPEVGIVGPMTDSCKNKKQILTSSSLYKLQDHIEIIDGTEYVNGFCFAVRTAIMQCMGIWFDAANFPFYGNEHDFIIRLRERGYKAAIDHGLFVNHVGEVSAKMKYSGEAFEIERKKGRDNMMEKHGHL